MISAALGSDCGGGGGCEVDLCDVRPWISLHGECELRICLSDWDRETCMQVRGALNGHRVSVHSHASSFGLM